MYFFKNPSCVPCLTLNPNQVQPINQKIYQHQQNPKPFHHPSSSIIIIHLSSTKP